ncbi:resolvase-like protein, partial [Larkinella arboricola]
MLIGYARVSTQDQNLNLQLDDLMKAGCERIFQEKASSAKDRAQLQKLLEALREGDTVVV